MNFIKLLTKFNLAENYQPEKNKEINVLFNEERSKVIEVKLFNGEILAKHSTPSPIMVLCLSGNGIFKAGENLEEEQKLTQGALIYLEKEIMHEVVAGPDLRILVTKFSE